MVSVFRPLNRQESNHYRSTTYFVNHQKLPGKLYNKEAVLLSEDFHSQVIFIYLFFLTVLPKQFAVFN